MPHPGRNALFVTFTALFGLLALHGGGLDLARPTARAAASFNVNSLGDGSDSDLADGICNDGSGQCTLRAAIEQANQLAGTDTINVTAAGTISLTSALPRLTSMTIAGPGPAQLTVRRDPGAATSFRVFRTEFFSAVGISGLMVSGGRPFDDDGGGIYNSQSTALSLSNVVVSGNATEIGLTSSSGRGGGIFSEGTSLTLTNTTVSGNSTANARPLSSSSGRPGGGIYVHRGTLAVVSSTVSGNVTGDQGDVNSTPGWGGGIYIASSEAVTLTDSTVSGNRTGTGFRSRGGGIFHEQRGPLTLKRCTVSDNTASTGGGIVGGDLANNGVKLQNTIVANNNASSSPDLSGTFNSLDFNLIRDTSGATINGTTTHNLTGVDPLLSPLQDNGGPTRTHALLSGSPAIDAGDSGGLTADQRGLPRPFDSPSAANASDGADIGAYEAQAPSSAGQIQFSAAAFSAAEGAGTAAITVTRTGGSAGAVSVTFSTSNGTAVAPQDYVAVAGLMVSFADGDTAPKTVQVQITDDALDEPDETVNLSLSTPAGGPTLVGSPGVATLNITDDDPLPSLSVGDVTVTEGDADNTPAIFVVSLSAPSGKTVTVSYGTANGTASAADDYRPFFSSLSFAPGETSKTVVIQVFSDLRVEPDETFSVNLSGPSNASVASSGTATIVDDDASSVQFGTSSYTVTEGGPVDVVVTRTGSTSREAFVSYATAEGTANGRQDYTATAGRLRFGPGDTSKTFRVLTTDDRFNDDGESFSVTLSDPASAGSGAQGSAVINIVDNEDQDLPSPIGDTGFFVPQHYADFLNREPDTDGLNFWIGEIEQCGTDAQCREVKRINVSAAFFLSIEFQQTGYLAYRARKAAFGNLAGKPVPVTRDELLRDVSALGAGVIVGANGWEQRLEQNKQSYFAQLGSSTRFTTLHPQALTTEQFVDALNANAGGALSQAERDALVDDLRNRSRTRAQVLRAVTEDADLARAEFNKAFVLMQYFGYLRRDPDAAPDTDFSGYNFWLGKLNEFNGNFIQAEMVKAFLDSTEYKQRFGQ